MGREGEDVLCSLKLTEDEGKNYEHATMYRLGRESVLSGEFAFIVFSGHPPSPKRWRLLLATRLTLRHFE